MKTAQMTKDERRMYRCKLLEQKLIGLMFLVMSAIVIWICSNGTTPEDRDATAVVMLVPLGLWMLFTKQIVIY